MSRYDLSNDFEKQFHRALDLKKDGSYNESIQILLELIKQEPNYPFTFVTLGYNYAAIGEFTHAINALRVCINLAPHMKMASSKLAKLLLDTHNGEEARKEVTRFIDEYPLEQSARLTKLLDYGSYFESPEYAGLAYIVYTALLISDSRCAEALRGLGRATTRLNFSSYKTHEKALHMFFEALKVEENSGTYYEIAQAYYQLGEDIKAKEYCRKAIELDSKNQEALSLLGELLEEEDISLSEELQRQALNIDSEYQIAAARLGRLLHFSERYDEAEFWLLKTISLDRNDVWSIIYLAKLYGAKGEYVKAKSYYRKAWALWRNSYIPYFAISQSREDVDKADKFLRMGIRKDKNEPQAYFVYAEFLLAEERIDEAMDNITKAMELAPKDKDIIGLCDKIMKAKAIANGK